MRLLLDTHIWLWFVIEPRRIGRHTLQLLKNAENELWLSPISTWEALTLHSKKRINLAGDLNEWVSLATLGLKEALPTHEIAVAAGELPLHKDPVDRIIAGTALVLDLTLVTADERLLRLGSIRTLANR